MCGSPTHECGEALNDSAYKKAVGIVEKYDNAAYHTEMLYGECCNFGYDEKPIERITRDMAIDAGDLSLEGQIY